MLCECGDNCQCVDCSCGSVLYSSLEEADALELSEGFAALSDPVRLRLLNLLATAPSEAGISVCDLISPLGKSQSTVSHHMKVLADAGLVEGDKQGRLTSYRVVTSRVSALQRAIGQEHARV
jgi:ArsR family transcriptional regulator, arsenate/arsenite/antimonite-responsive transcriptional repressor